MLAFHYGLPRGGVQYTSYFKYKHKKCLHLHASYAYIGYYIMLSVVNTRIFSQLNKNLKTKLHFMLRNMYRSGVN